MREKPYYNLISEEVKQAAPCAQCGSVTSIEQCWVEYGHGWLPDDYVYKTVCVCGADEDEVIAPLDLIL